MVQIISDNGILELKDEYADYSTFMRGGRSFSMSSIGRNEVDARCIAKTVYLDRRDRWNPQTRSTTLIEYIKFLKGEEFIMNDDVGDLFGWMGHVNTCRSLKRKRLQKWKQYLVNQWYRKFIHSISDPYAGLVEVDTKGELDVTYSYEIPNDDIVISGRILLRVIGVYQDEINDIQLYTNDEHILSTGYIWSFTRYFTFRMTTPIRAQALHLGEKTPSQIAHRQRGSKDQIVYIPHTKKIYMSRLTYYRTKPDIDRYRSHFDGIRVTII